MKKITLPALLLILLFLNSLHAQNIVINEILTSNTLTNQDEDGSYQDWVELYNNGPADVNLNGYGLTDDATLPFKWVFPNVTVNAGQYLLVWCSDKNRTVVGQPLHTNWKISSSGETITLTNPSNVTVSSVPPVNLQSDISYGRLPNGTGPYVYFGQVTPNAANASVGYSGTLNPPTISQNSGFFTAGFNVTLASPDPGTTLIYTLDGSEPDPNNLGGTTYHYKNQYPEAPSNPTGPLLAQIYRSFQYTAPVAIADRTPQPNKISAISSTYSFDPSYYLPDNPVFKGTVIRVKAIKAGSLPSKTVSRSYFISPQGPNRFTLPVVSLSVNENEFFDYNDGIYVAGVDLDNWRIANPTVLSPRGLKVGNYYRSGIANEKRANMAYFVNGAEVLNQDVGLRIRGASTRRYESKSLTVYARSDYGDESLSYKFFPQLADNSFPNVTLSNSGSDFLNTMFRDALDHELCKELHVENEDYQPTIVFLNGEYWGILNLRERYDDDYFDRVYGFKDVDLLENEGLAENGEVEEGDDLHYQAMMSYLNTHSLAADANYNYIKTQLDPESFTDYEVSNIFFQNSDWPNNNIQYWRKKTAAYEPNAPYGLDGRWRWSFHDMDDTFSFGTDNFNGNTLNIATSVNNNGVNPAWATLILRRLLENPNYKNDFISRFADLLNTSFLSSRIVSTMNTMKNGIIAEMPEKITRWSLPETMAEYNDYITYQTDFANARPAFQRNHIRSKFGIASNINATLNVSNAAHGYVRINTIDIKSGTPGIVANPYPWTGIYFSNIPVKLKAIPNPGYAFSHWEGASTATTADITLTQAASFSVTAVFVPAVFAAETSVPFYFWMMNGSIPNNQPLTTLNSTYELGADAVIQYQSCLAGYPFTSADPLWRKASMERRNAPTPINYRPEANGNLPYVANDIKGLQITQPFQAAGLENTMVFSLSTVNYKKIKFSFAAMDELAATGMTVDYAVNPGAPVWITGGLAATAFPLTTNTFQLYELDFSAITTADNNPNFKVRIRFTGPNMTASAGNRVTFNNIALDGVKLPLIYNSPNVFTVGTAVANLVPTVAAAVTVYSISPALPAGLSFDTATGIISGTPTTVTPTATYTVTAANAGGTATFGISITIVLPAPTALSYTSPNTFTVNSSVVNLAPTVSGSVSSYSVSPALPNGLSLNPTTGIISGMPTVISATAIYTVTATNSGGNTTFGISIMVNDVAPNSLTYTSPNTFTVNSSVVNLAPTVSGSVSSYSVSPALPNGLSLNPTTGIISGMPTVISATAIYTVTATNSGGNTTFGISIMVNDVAPNSLTYTSPNTFTVNSSVVNLAPTVSGSVSSYSVSPALPNGLSLNPTTGIISGTPTTVSATAIYTITAANSGGNTSFGISITVNDVAPNSLSYNSPNIFTVNSSVVNLAPTVSGNVISYSVSPALPNGLSLNPTTGIISGTPTIISATAIYTVTATNSGGNTSFGISITVNDAAPNSLSYNSPDIFTVNSSVVNLAPTVSGSVISYSVSPALPNGLSLNPTTGIISGMPTIISATAIYTVTATNSGGNTTFGISITVNDAAPNSLSYNSPNIFTANSSVVNLAPTVSGNVNNYSVSPALPNGLSLNPSTGIISGTPTVISATAIYTVTATNLGGNTTFGISITVNDVAPNSLTYTSPNVFTVNNSVVSLAPTVSGNVNNYSISPALPNGLSLNPSTGIISGMPTVISATAIYTVTATNSGGNTSFGISITVNDAAPNSLSYTSPNVFIVNSSVVNLVPTVSGNVISYSVSPALPNGLSLNPTTGIISGMPTVISATAIYTVTATNSGGNTSFGISITVNDVAPNSLSYNSPNIFTANSSVVNLAPTVSGLVSSYIVSPALPNGLSLNPTTGIISGMPTVISATAIYTVTATNSGGNTTFGISITVNDAAPNSLTYTSPNVFTVNSSVVNLAPTVSGNVILYSVSPALPNGLSLNPTTGIISGTPTQISPATAYTLTAGNSGGSVSFDVIITVNPEAPADLAYISPNVFTVGTAIADLIPNVIGSVSNFSIFPVLPDGLSFDTATGIISGIPTATSPMAPYIITASNTGGNVSFVLSITINDAAPTALGYNSPNLFTVNTSEASLIPAVIGNAISFSVSPTLPQGLVFDATTGIISGTPIAVSATAIYTVTATNSGGSITFAISITVNDTAPESLSYTTPNVFTVNGAAVNLIPQISGNTTSYTVFPQLPDGLVLDAATGVISGTPTVVSAAAVYTVTASNSGGSTTFGVSITVNDAAPLSLIYTTPNVLVLNAPATLTPTVVGNVSDFTITCCLPPGMAFDPLTGIVSGTPTVTMDATVYTVTATNSGGSISFELSIAVNDTMPSALSYPSPNVFHVNHMISELVPSVNGNVISYSISPDLPDGLAFDTATGVISGTPAAVTSTATYTVTATNSGGSITFEIVITVDEELNTIANDAVGFLVYPNPFTDYVNVLGIDTKASYKLFAVDGKLIREGELRNNRIDFGALPEGMYLLRLASGNKTSTRKIIRH